MAHRFPPLAPQDPRFTRHAPRPLSRPHSRPLPPLPAAEVWLMLSGVLTVVLALV